MNYSTALLLISAFLHAAWNVIAKTSRDKAAFLFVAMSMGNIVAGLAVWQQGSFHLGDGINFAILAGLFEGAYFVTLGKALAQSDFGQSYSIMRGGAMLFVWVISILCLKETATIIQATGVACVFLGIVLLNGLDGAKKQGLKLFFKNYWSWACAITIAGYHLSYHRALQHGADPKNLFALAMLISWPFLFFAIGENYYLRIQTVIRKNIGKALITGVGSYISFVIFLYGLAISSPGYAISLRNSSIFFGILFALFLREKLAGSQILGAIVVGIGAFLLSL